MKEGLGGGGDRVHRLVECLRVMHGRRPEPADLPDVLQRRGPHVGVGHVLGIRLTQGLDAATHDTTVPNNRPARRHPAGPASPPGEVISTATA